MDLGQLYCLSTILAIAFIFSCIADRKYRR